MDYIKALEIIEKEFETRRESSHNKIIKTGLTYDGCNGFCVSIYDDNGVALITDLGETKEVFDEVFALFNGRPGPAGSATTVVYYLFRKFYEQFNYGVAAASGIVLFLIVLGITIIQYLGNRYFEKRGG